MPVERPRPIAHQVSDILVERIRSEEYAPGLRLPSENLLAEELGVSRATVRSALARLAAEGLLLRKQGDGTYVNQHITEVPTRLGGIWNFYRLIEQSGRMPLIETINVTARTATEEELVELALEEEAEVVALHRLFLADGVPVILARNIIPTALLNQPFTANEGTLPIEQIVQRYANKQISYVIFDIAAIMPDAAAQSLLNCSVSQPILSLKQKFYDKQNTPLFCGDSVYNDRVLGLRLAQAWN
ncbi:MAG: GntR family transcriptional regulator [Caldilineales bacterium]|nr:GntR family transcriptional regulator [Caldilineales bacterium]